MTAASDFPFGEREPEGGFQVGDYVGLIYSDHEEYIFDNPEGMVTAVENEDECVDGEHPDPCAHCQHQYVTVQVEAQIGADRVYLIKRGQA